MDSLPTPAAHEFLSSVSRIPKKKELPQAPALDEEAPEEPGTQFDVEIAGEP